jgi:hypothetical protein
MVEQDPNLVNDRAVFLYSTVIVCIYIYRTYEPNAPGPATWALEGFARPM